MDIMPKSANSAFLILVLPCIDRIYANIYVCRGYRRSRIPAKPPNGSAWDVDGQRNVFVIIAIHQQRPKDCALRIIFRIKATSRFSTPVSRLVRKTSLVSERRISRHEYHGIDYLSIVVDVAQAQSMSQFVRKYALRTVIGHEQGHFPRQRKGARIAVRKVAHPERPDATIGRHETEQSCYVA